MSKPIVSLGCPNDMTGARMRSRDGQFNRRLVRGKWKWQTQPPNRRFLTPPAE